jgi:outer membrane protein assembly factor BamB
MIWHTRRRALVIFMVLIPALLMGCTVVITGTTTPTTSQASILWSVGIPNSAQFIPYLTEARGNLYYNFPGDAKTPSGLRAVQASDGSTILWSQSLSLIYGAVPVVDSNVVLDSVAKEMVAFNAQTGAKLWTFADQDFGLTYTTPNVSNRVIYFSGSFSGILYALREQTGALLWSTQLGSGSQILDGPPVVADGIVYTGGLDGRWYAVNAATGKVLWSYQTLSAGQDMPTFSSGVVANDVAYFYSGSPQNSGAIGSLYAVRLSDHTLLWKQAVSLNGPPPAGLAPVVSGKSVYFESNNALVAFDAATGQAQWQVDNQTIIDGEQFIATGEIVVANGTIYCSGITTLSALSTAGAPLWSISLPGALGPQFTLDNNVIYIGAADTIGGRITAVSIG